MWTLALLVSLVAFPAAAADPLAVRVFTDKADYERTEQALITLEVKNTSSLFVNVSFNNGQQYEFEARDASGATLWTWSYGKTFSPNSSSKLLAPGETWQVQEAWSFTDNAGSAVFDGTFTVTGTYLGNYLGKSGTKSGSQDITLITPDPLEVTFATDKTSYSKLSSPATLTLTVTNIAPYTVTIDFQNGQSFDFSAKNASGSTVWTWSYGQTFDPAPTQLVLAPGQSQQYTGSWAFKNDSGSTVADGNYTVSGTFLGQTYGSASPKGGESQIRLYTLF